MSKNKDKDHSESESDHYIIEFDNSSNEHESEISLSSVVDNISILIIDIEEKSDTSDTSSESWTEIYQNKTGISKEELHDFITQYKDFFGNEKLDNDKRKKLIMLVKNMILISSSSPIKKK
jgi:hypothetical protein